ncbi:MAG: response regulator receiver [Verrucomicrobiales bacterium]|nr:response regulator receiver [Verrucomicrobiales bacterium]
MQVSPASETAVSPKIAVWLIEDHDDFRSTVARLIDRIKDTHCPRNFSSCEEALAALREDRGPEIILSDIGLPGMNGIEGIRKIKALSPATHIIMLTVHDDHDKIFQAICAGASGYLLKTSSRQTITTAIQDVLNGGAPMHPRVAKLVLEMFARQSVKTQKKEYGLSPREQEVLELMSQGLIKKEIANELSLSFFTVDHLLRAIYDKLHVHTRSGAVAKAVRERLV